MLPDVSGLDRVFDYLLPTELAAARVGSVVRVPLHGRNVRGWIVDEPAGPPPGLDLRALRSVRALLAAGPAPEVVALARFGAWRYAGRLRPFLLAASPRRLADASPERLAPRPRWRPPPPGGDEVAAAVREALASSRSTLRLPPAAERLPVVSELLAAVAGRGDLLVLVPERRDVDLLVARLGRLGVPAARHPEEWAACAAGGRVVVGTRTAALAPVGSLAGVLVLDAQAEAYVDERAPTYSGVVLARERARRAKVPFLAVSPCPPLELLVGEPPGAGGWLEPGGPPALGGPSTSSRPPELAGPPTPPDQRKPPAPPVVLPTAIERSRWPAIEILDRRGDDPRTGRYAERLAPAIRQAREEQPSRPVLCVLNRTGRARRLACASCFELVRCERCGAALAEETVAATPPTAATAASAPTPPTAAPAVAAARRLGCPRCGSSRPFVCATCGGAKLKVLRVGAARAGEELAALTGLEVVTVAGGPAGAVAAPGGSAGLAVGGTAGLAAAPGDSAGLVAVGGGAEARSATPLYVGTEALLHRVARASLVVFLDFDLDLLAPRLRAGEHALELIARAGRLVGGRPGGRVVVQTRCPDHEVLEAARLGDPGRFAEPELARRAVLEMPPFRAVALLSGPEAAELARRLVAEEELEAVPRLTGEDGEQFLVRARDDATLAAALERQQARSLDVRVGVDPIAW